MISPKKKPPVRKFAIERLLILITALALVVYLIVDGTLKNEIDRIYVIGLLVAIIGYFVRDLTDEDDEETP